MIALPTDDSLLSTLKIVLIFTGAILAFVVSLALSIALSLLAFHAGRWVYGCPTNWDDLGSLGAIAGAFMAYIGLINLMPYGADLLRYVLLNVPFGVGSLAFLIFMVFAVGVGIGRVTGLIRGKASDKERTE